MISLAANVRPTRASMRVRIFAVAWFVYSAHFATNVVREHYPAFTLAERGSLRVDDYLGFHADIFRHTDGHAYINNQVLTSVAAALPLWLFDPALDALQARRLDQLRDGTAAPGEYRNPDRPVSMQFFRLVKERGLDLRFGAATAITTVFLMAPLSALLLVVFFDTLSARPLSPANARGLTLLLAFGTPLFFRTTGLNHNMFVLYFSFAAFLFLWSHHRDGPLRRHRLAAGLMCGLTLATDYVGLAIVPVLYFYFLVPRSQQAGRNVAFRESLDVVAGSLPAVAFLLGSQWAMFGHPLWPAQFWMPHQNVYVGAGLRGVTLVDIELLYQNLFHPGFGLFVWGPVLALALVPVGRGADAFRVLPRRERWFVLAMSVAVLVFSSMNQYARLQWNSGFRYLVPLLPLLVLALADTWVRLPRPARAVLGLAAGLHSWVLATYRESAPRAWDLFLTEGPQLPWLRVIRMTAPPDDQLLSSWWLPLVLLMTVGAIAMVLWRYGRRADVPA